MAKTPAGSTPIARDFSAPALLLVLVGAALNYLGGTLAAQQALPLPLDMLGTVLAGVLAGPWIGALTALLYYLGLGLTIDPGLLPGAPAGVLVGLAAGWMARAGWFERWYRVLWAGLALGALALLSRGAVQALFLGRAGAWGELLAVDSLYALGGWLALALAVFLIYKLLPPRLLARFPGSARRKKSRTRSIHA